MEGIKEAIAYITGLAVKAEKPETIEINGRTYCTKDLKRYDAADKAEPIKATTLTSLVDYIKESQRGTPRQNDHSGGKRHKGAALLRTAGRA